MIYTNKNELNPAEICMQRSDFFALYDKIDISKDELDLIWSNIKHPVPKACMLNELYNNLDLNKYIQSLLTVVNALGETELKKTHELENLRDKYKNQLNKRIREISPELQENMGVIMLYGPIIYMNGLDFINDTINKLKAKIRNIKFNYSEFRNFCMICYSNYCKLAIANSDRIKFILHYYNHKTGPYASEYTLGYDQYKQLELENLALGLNTVGIVSGVYGILNNHIAKINNVKNLTFGIISIDNCLLIKEQEGSEIINMSIRLIEVFQKLKEDKIRVFEKTGIWGKSVIAFSSNLNKQLLQFITRYNIMLDLHDIKAILSDLLQEITTRSINETPMTRILKCAGYTGLCCLDFDYIGKGQAAFLPTHKIDKITIRRGSKIKL